MDELRSTSGDQQSVAVTIYNEDLALVKDRRRVALPQGESQLAFRDVSARIRPETALLQSLTEGGGIAVIEQNFDFDLLTPEKLLEKYVGREVGVIKTHPTTGEETEERGTVLSAAEGTVLRIGDRIETVVLVIRIERRRSGAPKGPEQAQTVTVLHSLHIVDVGIPFRVGIRNTESYFGPEIQLAFPGRIDAGKKIGYARHP